MIFIYTLLNIVLFFYGIRLYKYKLNPLSLYVVVWEAAVLLHECGLIYYYELSVFTWAVIIGAEILFVLSCIFGIRLKKNIDTLNHVDEQVEQKKILKFIVITSAIASVSILFTTFQMVGKYGFNLLAYTNTIYSNRVDLGITVRSIPYLGSFIYITAALDGIYLKKYGFNKWLVPSFVLIILSSLDSGGRAGIVFFLLIVAFAYFSTGRKEKKVRKISKRRRIAYIGLVAGVVTLIVFLVRMSQIRAGGIVPVYATERYIRLFGRDATLYKAISYVAGPIGALNEYLKTCDFNFGQNTFLTIYNLLARIGIIDQIRQYQENFATPIMCNVATWVRELIEDFTLPGAIVFLFGFGAWFSHIFVCAKKTNSIRYIVLNSLMLMVISISFFDWGFRRSSTWIALIFGYIIGKQIDKKSNVLSQMEIENKSSSVRYTAPRRNI